MNVMVAGGAGYIGSHAVKQLIDAGHRVYGPRRPGDPAISFANADKIRRELGWSARYVELDAIVATAWRWFEKHLRGYA
jgi:UDP-glucose 4-epimerase